MQWIRFCLLLGGLLVISNSHAQQLPPPGVPSVATPLSKLPRNNAAKKTSAFHRTTSISAGLGMAGYWGDLMKNSAVFTQPGFSLTAGLRYSLSRHWGTRLYLGFHQVQAYDNKSGGAYPDRNLSFKSKIIEFALTAEYTLMNLETHRFSPYVFAGIGLLGFNPQADDAAGATYALRPLGTEGQGLPGYPGLYSNLVAQFPMGWGFKYKINNRLMLLGEFNIRATTTDYLDDVSTFYPAKALLDARNPETAPFTYRGTGGYPANPKLRRGDPDNKDLYYTTQLQLDYTLQKRTRKPAAKPEPALPVSKPLAETDTDNDGVTDELDKCPAVAGSKENNGCPLPFIEGANLVNVTPDSMTYRIYFDMDRALLLSDAFKTLQGVIAILDADNTLSVRISGHSDNSGTNSVNMQISAERANITRDYLLSYNVAAEKITTDYHGNHMPVDETQQWRNRRVDITIIKK